MSSVDQTASKLMSFMPQDGASNAYLLVLDDDRSSIFHLPRSGAIVIGRDADADLKVARERESTHVSRRHATIQIKPNGLHIADLGSKHGTRLNGEPLTQSRTLASGDVINVGEVVLVLHFSTPLTLERAEHPEAGWRRRLAEEVERAITFGRPLAVVVLTGVSPAALHHALRMIDVVGIGADRQPLLLLPEADRAQALEIAKRAVDAAPKAFAGLAMCPADACDADSIMLAARAAMRRAAPGTVACASDEGGVVSLAAGRDVLIADPAVKQVFDRLSLIARHDLPVLIIGEPGVGKENAAYAVHHHAKREGEYRVVDCTSLGPDSLVDDELFGHEKGAFTGAVSEKKGPFEIARGGTVFLDEIGELPLPIQAKLLRTLENRTIRRVGGSHDIPIDVRFVAATNRSLDDEVAAGRFRADLLSRLGATVILPPLRNRKTEIPLLARSFLAAACKRAGRGPMTITPAAIQALLGYPWPGNVRELKQAVELAIAIAPDDTIEVTDLPDKITGAAPEAPVAPPAPPTAAPSNGFRPLADEIEELERRRMGEALTVAGGVKTRAAQLIGMPIRTFTHKMKHYGM